MEIGQVARRVGVSAKMIRHYEATGLLPTPARRANNYRNYDEADVGALQFIRRARDLGFSVSETRDLLALWRNPRRASRAVKVLAERQVAELDRRAAEMRAMADTLRVLARACHGDDRPDCPILAELSARP